MAATTETLRAFGRASAASQLVPGHTTLPLTATALQAGIAAVYHAAVQGAPRSECLRMLCIDLGKRLGAALVLIARKSANGTFVIDAESSDNAVALAFHRVPECWDGAVASQGPACSAVRARGAVRIPFSAEALGLWRAASQQERISEVIALPLAVGDDILALELFYVVAPMTQGAEGLSLETLALTVQRLLEDLELIERQRVVAAALEQCGNAAFITDAHGTFAWINPAFERLSGYSAQDVRGRDPRLLHSGKQGVRYYRELWSRIRSGKVWSGETIDRDKSGKLYTIRQTVSPIVRDGRITHYLSIHEDIGAQKRREEALELATGVDRRTGLLTRAAFEAAARDALSTLAAKHNGAELVLISLRGLRKASESFGAELEDFLTDAMGRRVREAVPAPHLAAATGPYEYAALIQDDQLSGSSLQHWIDDLRERVGEPLLYLGNSLDVDAQCAHSSYPSSGESFEALWASADRQLANEPVARTLPIRPH